jgi:hypothetical protein
MAPIELITDDKRRRRWRCGSMSERFHQGSPPTITGPRAGLKDRRIVKGEPLPFVIADLVAASLGAKPSCLGQPWPAPRAFGPSTYSSTLAVACASVRDLVEADVDFDQGQCGFKRWPA